MVSSRSVEGRPCVRCKSTERHPGGRCAPCSRRAASAWLEMNRERKRLRENQAYHANPEKKRRDAQVWGTRNAERKRTLAALWRLSHPERSRAASEEWRLGHLAKVKEMNRLWRMAHPQSILTYGHAARARRRACPGKHSPAQWRVTRASYHGLCVYCLAPATQRDHVVPLIAGGTNDIDNIVPACKSCNSSKNAKPLLVWLTRRALTTEQERECQRP